MKHYRRTIYLLLILGLWLSSVGLIRAQNAIVPQPVILINQIDFTPSQTPLLRVELYDGGNGAMALNGLVLVFFTQSTHQIVATLDLAGFVTDDNGFLTLDTGELTQQDGEAADAVAIYAAAPADFPVGAKLDHQDWLDALAYTTDAEGAIEALSLPATPVITSTVSLSATVALTDVNAPAAIALQPANANLGACGADAAPIHALQGAGERSPQIGKTVTIEGSIIGDFQDTRKELRGFFIQEEATDIDADPLTSEGIFVLDNGFGVDVAVGNVVRLRGKVDEFNGLTRLKNVNGLSVCPQTSVVTPTVISLPETVNGDLEHYEGMLVQIDGEMTVAQTYFIGRYGQLTLAADGRLYQPTHLYTPGSPDAVALADENARRLLVLDDGQDIRALGDNPDPVPYLGAPPPGVLRAGDGVTNLVGVLDYGRINSAPQAEVGLDYRLQPTLPPIFIPMNERNTAPPDVGGAIQVASFNVLNYFNGDGVGGGFPTARGAKTAIEFQRQHDKINAALLSLGAEVIGLMEIENDGYGPDSAIQSLVDSLNEVAGPLGGSYNFINPGGERLGGDEISIGLLYNPSMVKPIGAAVTLATGPFDQTLADGRSRQPLAQTFEDLNGERFTVVVNHFKSKRPSENATGGNADMGDGAGAWNQQRTEAAQALMAWLATDPTGSGDPDVLIIGDLNAYAKETPIAAIENAGYTNLLERFGGAEAYSFVFDGQSGYLDHALASSSLITQVTGASDWHINADEPKVLDYDQEFNPPGYYAPTPFRSSDHDAVLIGLTLATKPAPDEGGGDGEGQEGGGQEGGEGSGDGGETDGIAPGAERTHQVRPGDNLSRIARYYSITIAALAQANGLRTYSPIYIDQTLRIPPVQTDVRCRTYYTAQTGETSVIISDRLGVDPGRFAYLNGVTDIYAVIEGQQLCIPDIYSGGYQAPPQCWE